LWTKAFEAKPDPADRSRTVRLGEHVTRAGQVFDPGARVQVSLTLGAADNLAALRARSPRIPLRDTAEVAVRMLVDHLSETGWNVVVTNAVDAPIHGMTKETR
jgi:type VII secretion protein EccE